MNTRRQAELCAASAPPVAGLGILIGTLTLIEIIYYGFELWKEWRAGACASHPQTAITGTMDGASYSPVLQRKAARKLRRASNYCGHPLEQDDAEVLAKHMLDHVVSAESDTVSVCCDESPDASVPAGLFGDS